jgi:hypothetical protein
MKIKLLLALLLIGYEPIAQVKTLPPIIKKLLSVEGQVIIYPQTDERLIDIKDLPKNFENSGQLVLKIPNALLVCIPGTGRIYKLDSLNNTYRWQRIDSTYYSGYNFGCTYFQLDSTLYSFGGNGFWHVNGDLRYFNPRIHEWNARPVSEAIPFISSNPFTFERLQILDTAEKKLYIQSINVSADYIIDRRSIAPFKNKLFALDIVKGIWTTLGEVKDSAYYMNGISPWGLFVNFQSFIDIKNNQILKLSTQKREELLSNWGSSISNKPITLSFFIDSTLYFGDFKDHLDSFKISSSDLIKTGLKFYTPLKENSVYPKENILFALTGSLTLLCLFLFVKLFSKNKNNLPIASIGIPKEHSPEIESPLDDSEKENMLSFRSSKIIDLLGERERDLLSFIYKQSLDERLTSIDEINKIIGAAQRTTDIQKRLRSDLITSINEKLSMLTNSKKPVIDKQRSEFDKRNFEYFIRPDQMELVEKCIREII